MLNSQCICDSGDGLTPGSPVSNAFEVLIADRSAEIAPVACLTPILEQPSFAQNESRALRDEYLVVNMHCTHLGCVPQVVPQVGPQPFDDNWKGGFFCPCHKSKFDMAGRVYKGVPAPANLRIPPYSFLDDSTLVIGVNPEGAV